MLNTSLSILLLICARAYQPAHCDDSSPPRPATRLAITLIAPLRDEHAAAAWAFAAAALWAGLAHDAFTVTWARSWGRLGSAPSLNSRQ
jgi:hypothetical protein